MWVSHVSLACASLVQSSPGAPALTHPRCGAGFRRCVVLVPLESTVGQIRAMLDEVTVRGGAAADEEDVLLCPVSHQSVPSPTL